VWIEIISFMEFLNIEFSHPLLGGCGLK